MNELIKKIKLDDDSANQVFKDRMMDKVREALDMKKIEVTSSVFNSEDLEESAEVVDSLQERVSNLLEADEDAESIANTLKDMYLKEFPNGHATVSKAPLGSDTFYLNVYIGKPDTWANGISQNDDLAHAYLVSKDSIESSQGIALMVDPEKKHLAMSRVKIPFRKKTGKNMISGMKKHFSGMRKIVMSNKDKIFHRKDIKL